MATDRKWFENTTDWFYLRPEIEGEFNEYTMLGHDVPTIIQYDLSTGEKIDTPANWVCVIDVGRAKRRNFVTPPSGFRMRYRCVAPLNSYIRQQIADYAYDMMGFQLDAIKAKPKRKGRKIARPKAMGFK